LVVTFTSRVALIAVTLFLVGFQIRYSIATWEARNTFLYIPFQLKSGTDTIESVGQAARGVLRRGDELIAVDGRPFTGMSVYREELRAANRYLTAANSLPMEEATKAYLKWPFRVTVRSGAGGTRTVEVYFANCTCGSLSQSQVVWYAILPPSICILVGLIAAWGSRWQSAVPWLFLAVAICVSQGFVVPEWSNEWSQSADPMEWRDWFRVPALAYQSFFGTSWQAWLLLFAATCFRQSVDRDAVLAVTPMLALAVLKTLATIGSSEYFRAASPLYHALDAASREISVVMYFCAALLAWRFGRSWTLLTTTFAVIAATLLCWPASVPPFNTTWMYERPAEYRTPEVIGAVFTGAVFVVLLAAGRRNAEPYAWMPLAIASMVLLLGPFIFSAVSYGWALWWMPQLVLTGLYFGLLGVGWFVLRIPARGPGGRTLHGSPAESDARS
jgi:hypothetical protein